MGKVRNGRWDVAVWALGVSLHTSESRWAPSTPKRMGSMANGGFVGSLPLNALAPCFVSAVLGVNLLRQCVGSMSWWGRVAIGRHFPGQWHGNSGFGFQNRLWLGTCHLSQSHLGEKEIVFVTLNALTKQHLLFSYTRMFKWTTLSQTIYPCSELSALSGCNGKIVGLWMTSLLPGELVDCS